MARAAALVRKGFAQNAPARNADGNPCDSISLDARAWSVTGALARALMHGDRREAITMTPAEQSAWEDVQAALVARLTGLKNGNPPAGMYWMMGAWNDAPGRTADEVAEMLDSIAATYRQAGTNDGGGLQ